MNKTRIDLMKSELNELLYTVQEINKLIRKKVMGDVEEYEFSTDTGGSRKFKTYSIKDLQDVKERLIAETVTLETKIKAAQSKTKKPKTYRVRF